LIWSYVLKEIQVPINDHPSKRRSLRCGPDHLAAIRGDLQVFGASPEDSQGPNTRIFASLLADKICQSGILRSLSKTMNCDIKSNIDVDIMLSWFEQNSVS